MARKPDGTTQEPGKPRARGRRQATETANAAPLSADRRRKPRSARPHLNMRGMLADAAPVSMPLEPLLAPKDVARYLGCTPKTVRRLVLDGHLRQLRIAGKATPRFRREHVEALVTVDPISRKRRGGGSSGTPTGGSTPPAP